MIEINKNKETERHPLCKAQTCNNFYDPIEYECGYFTTLDCDDCKYGGGKKNPEAKCNQEK